MNNCPDCGHELVNIIYGTPSQDLIAFAKSEDIALGGYIKKDSPSLYCYGCHLTYNK